MIATLWLIMAAIVAVGAWIAVQFCRDFRSAWREECATKNRRKPHVPYREIGFRSCKPQKPRWMNEPRPYVLTDGCLVAELRWMTPPAFAEANERALIATGSAWEWVEYEYKKSDFWEYA